MESIPREPRLADVAREAGVSTSTASRALNPAGGRVSPETVAAVQAAVERLGYQLDPIAKALREGSTKTIGVVVPVIANPIFAALVDSLEDRLRSHGLNLLLADSHGRVSDEAERLDMLVARRVDGVILIPADYERSRQAITRIAARTPIVLLDRYARATSVDTVAIDDYIACEQVVTHVRGTGAETAFLVLADDVTSTGRDRALAFREAAAQHGLSIVGEHRHDVSMSTGRAGADVIAALPTRPDAVLTGSDVIAFGLVSQLRRHGIRVPGDLIVTGFDGTEFSDVFEPGMTSVHQPLGDISSTVVDCLLARIADPKAPARISRLVPELVARDSTARTAS